MINTEQKCFAHCVYKIEFSCHWRTDCLTNVTVSKCILPAVSRCRRKCPFPLSMNLIFCYLECTVMKLSVLHHISLVSQFPAFHVDITNGIRENNARQCLCSW